jgi:hypothetical protein
VRTFLRRSKDATLAFTARVASNSYLKGIAEMTELSIDTKKRRIRAEIVDVNCSMSAIERGRFSKCRRFKSKQSLTFRPN